MNIKVTENAIANNNRDSNKQYTNTTKKQIKTEPQSGCYVLMNQSRVYHNSFLLFDYSYLKFDI